jgi:pilus assembly protein CpaE
VTESEGDNIRLLIVDDFAETRENIRKLLQFEADIQIVGSARSGEEALQLAHDTLPDVILMDINMPDMDGIAATEAILKDVPFAQIVILSVQTEQDYMRRAMLAGARDFISKPPSGDELISTIRVVSQRAHEQRKALEKPAQAMIPMEPGMAGGRAQRPLGKVISVYSAKGGVGCTTLACNLAIGLNTEETPAVLVDANLQFGDISVFMNLQVKNSMIDLAARADEIDPDIVEEVLMAHECGLHVLAAPPRPEMADEIHAEQVRKVLQYLRRTYPYVIVDTSSTMDDITLAVLDVTDLLVAVATPDIPSIKDSRLLFDLLNVLEFPRERLVFVLNKMDKKSGITAEAVSENLKQPVDGEIISEERVVGPSINRGVPFMLGDRSRPPAKNVIELLGAIKQKLVQEVEAGDEERPQERARLFGR